MSIISIKEHWDGITGSYTSEKLVREYSRLFKVVVSSKSEDIVATLASGSLPQVNSSVYPTDAGALCVKASWKMAGGASQSVFDITYSYTSNPPPPEQQVKNPLDRPPVWKFNYQLGKEPTYEDLDNEAIINSAYMAYESVIEFDKGVQVLTVQKNYDPASWDGELLFTLNNSINSSAFHLPGDLGDLPTYSCKIQGITGDLKEENGQSYYDLTFNIAVDRDLYFPQKILSCGFAELIIPGDPSGGVQQLRDGHGQPVTKPQLLDGNGRKTNTAVYDEYNIYHILDWTGIVPGQ